MKLWHSPTDGRSQSREPWARHPEHPCLSLHQSPLRLHAAQCGTDTQETGITILIASISWAPSTDQARHGDCRISSCKQNAACCYPSITQAEPRVRGKLSPLARVAGPERSRAENKPGHRAPRGPSDLDTGVWGALLHVPETMCSGLSEFPRLIPVCRKTESPLLFWAVTGP